MLRVLSCVLSLSCLMGWLLVLFLSYYGRNVTAWVVVAFQVVWLLLLVVVDCKLKARGEL